MNTINEDEEKAPDTVHVGGVSKADWVPYQGPKGGEGWQNVESGEVVYDDTPPGDIEVEAETYYEAETAELVNALAEVTGRTPPEELYEEEPDDLRQQIQDLSSPKELSEIMDALPERGESDSGGSENEEDGFAGLDIDTEFNVDDYSERDKLLETVQEYPEVFEVVEEVNMEMQTDKAFGEFVFQEEFLTGDNESELHFSPDFGEETAKVAFEDGYLAGDDMEHIFLHEAVHAMDWAQGSMEDRFKTELGGDQKRIAEQVSEYASENIEEAIAEIGALMLQGEELSEDVEWLYNRYNGPEL